MKNVFDFEMYFKNRTCFGDFWKGCGWIKGKFYIVDSLFLGYSKKDIEKALKDLIREKARKEA